MNFDEWICFGIPEYISQDACAWLAKLDGGNLSLSEQTEFYTWLALDPQHQWAFEELTELWAKTALLDNLKFEHVPLQLVQSFPYEESCTLNNFNPPAYQQYLPFIALGLAIVGLLVGYL